MQFNLCCFKKKRREKWGVFLMWIINRNCNTKLNHFYIKYNQFGKNMHTATLVAQTISYCFSQKCLILHIYGIWHTKSESIKIIPTLTSDYDR